MAIRFHLDEHIDSAIAVGLRRRGIDVTTTNDAGLRGAGDEAQLTFAMNQRRVIHTNDPDFLRLDAVGFRHFGIVFCSFGSRTIGQVIEYLTVLDAVMTEEEMLNRVEFC